MSGTKWQSVMEDIELKPVYARAIRLFMNSSKNAHQELLNLHKEHLQDADGAVKFELKTSTPDKELDRQKIEKLKTELISLAEEPLAKIAKIEILDVGGGGDMNMETQADGVLTTGSVSPELDVLNDSIGLDLSELSCIVCGNMRVSQGNQLVECQYCHNLYHQECHRPSVPESEFKDPRSTWTCFKCLKSMKKQVTKQSGKGIAATSPITVKKEKGAGEGPKQNKDVKVVNDLSSKPGPFAALSSFAAKIESSKPRAGQDKPKMAGDVKKAGSFLFEDPIRVGGKEVGKGKAELKGLGLSALARAEAVSRSIVKPIDNTKFAGLGTRQAAAGGSGKTTMATRGASGKAGDSSGDGKGLSNLGRGHGVGERRGETRKRAAAQSSWRK